MVDAATVVRSPDKPGLGPDRSGGARPGRVRSGDDGDAARRVAAVDQPRHGAERIGHRAADQPVRGDGDGAVGTPHARHPTRAGEGPPAVHHGFVRGEQPGLHPRAERRAAGRGPRPRRPHPRDLLLGVHRLRVTAGTRIHDRAGAGPGVVRRGRGVDPGRTTGDRARQRRGMAGRLRRPRRTDDRRHDPDGADAAVGGRRGCRRVPGPDGPLAGRGSGDVRERPGVLRAVRRLHLRGRTPAAVRRDSELDRPDPVPLRRFRPAGNLAGRAAARPPAAPDRPGRPARQRSRHDHGGPAFRRCCSWWSSEWCGTRRSDRRPRCSKVPRSGPTPCPRRCPVPG